MITWHTLHPRARSLLGLIPGFLDADNPASAVEQLDASYQHGGGWRPMKGWTFNAMTGCLQYSGDEVLMPLAAAALRDETILVYDHAWVVVAQKDGSFEVARMD